MQLTAAAKSECEHLASKKSMLIPTTTMRTAVHRMPVRHAVIEGLRKDKSSRIFSSSRSCLKPEMSKFLTTK